ncbi:MAG: hypothetical protein LBV12_03535, partial [Puniceicoccales bacterium]|nr:hypothetical protein [Puniceicoccales bacterium]
MPEIADTAIRLLRDYTQAHGTSGFESSVRDIFVRELKNIDTRLATDKIGGVMCELQNGKAEPRVMLTAHMDEVGFIVQNITPDGFIQFAPLGGWNEGTLQAQRVRILSDNGKEYIGVIASIPKHFAGGDHGTPGIDRMAIDIGAVNRAQVENEFLIHIGSPIVPDGPFTPLANPRMFMAKAFDNRVGMAVLSQALNMIGQTPSDLPNQVVGFATVQEEVGVRGAETASALAKPDVAIVLEGPPADDSPGFNRIDSQGRLGGGVQIRVYDPTAIMSQPLVALALETAKQEKIPFQLTVR